MIILDEQKYLIEIEKNGISATDKHAEQKIKDYMANLVARTTYRKSKIIELTREVAEDYYSALPTEIVNKQLEALYLGAKSQKPINTAENKTITLYESEMQTIAELKDDKLMRLAFASLIIAKLKGMYLIDGERHYYSSIAACEADIYKIADLSSISGTTKNKLWKSLCEKGLIYFYVNINRAYRFNRDWIAIPMMTVTFNANNQKDTSNKKVFAEINNYDNILLWLRLWLEDKEIICCSKCGCPIEKRIKSVCLCEKCANKRKKASDKMRYTRKTA